MDRRASIVAAAVASLLSLGACQGYNFNPVGHCLIQPGTERVTLSKVSTADILFVVDDSGSMAGEQSLLASQFSQFITALDAANAERVANSLAPIDFHIAITTTSVFRSPRITGTSVCRNTCTGATGSSVCCIEATATPQPPSCRVDADCDTAHGYGCMSTTVCGAASAVGGYGCFTAACTPQQIPCSTLGDECGNIQEWYSTFSGCTPSYAPGLFTAANEYPMGRFMAAPSKPLVLHFDKDLYCAWDPATSTCTSPTPTDTTTKPGLITDFGLNVNVGTCGSNQEQGIEAARDAIERARGQRGGQPTGTGYTSRSDFLHDNSKLVVVWVTDEDDCSSPQNGADSVVFWQSPTSDGCRYDASLPAADQREFSATSVADYFYSLGRPFAVAFIANFMNGCNETTTCSIGSNCCDYACTGSPSICSNATCGGQGIPTRYKDLADELSTRGTEVVRGSVCDDFGAPGGSLERIAQIVKPPPGLTLPSRPAASVVTILRITKSDGTRLKSCYGPAPETMDYAAAVTAGYDWWFTASEKQTTPTEKDPSGVSRFVFINHLTNNCEANPGETYSADYLGQVPAGYKDSAGVWHEGGCLGATTALADQYCSDRLGGAPTDWTCFAGFDTSATPKCLSTATTRGTCVCGARTDTANPAASVCPGGSL